MGGDWDEETVFFTIQFMISLFSSTKSLSIGEVIVL